LNFVFGVQFASRLWIIDLNSLFRDPLGQASHIFVDLFHDA
jgi:hypothetical protein